MNKFAKQIKGSWLLMGGGFPGSAALLWTLGSVMLVIVLLFAVFETNVSSSNRLILLIGGEVQISDGSVAMILSIPFYLLLLVSIQQTSDKTEMLMNPVLNQMLLASGVRSLWLYAGAFLSRFAFLTIMLFIVWVSYNLLFFLLFGIMASGLAAFLGLMIVLLSLLVLYDVCYTASGSSARANSFVTILIVIMVILSSMVSSVPAGNLEWVNNWLIPDLLLRVYLVAEADLYGRFYTDLIKILPFIAALMLMNFLFIKAGRSNR
ncbi:MAG: hypothetical protein LAT84_09240 [Balneolia bacterium]|nr:hypothetical protein [Balneolia bacterium]